MLYRRGDESVNTLACDVDFFTYIPAPCRLSVCGESRGGVPGGMLLRRR